MQQKLVMQQVSVAVHRQRAKAWHSQDKGLVGPRRRTEKTPENCIQYGIVRTGPAWRRLAAPMESKEVDKICVS